MAKTTASKRDLSIPHVRILHVLTVLYCIVFQVLQLPTPAKPSACLHARFGKNCEFGKNEKLKLSGILVHRVSQGKYLLK